MAEKEGFEPSRRLWRLHDFQSCALDQTRRLLHITDSIINGIFLRCPSRPLPGWYPSAENETREQQQLLYYTNETTLSTAYEEIIK